MGEIDFPAWAVLQILDGGLVLAEAVGFPEVSRLGAGRERALRALRPNLARLVEESALAALHRRHPGGEPALITVEVPLAPATAAMRWRDELPLRFAAACWTHGEEAAVAFVPALGIYVLAEDLDGLRAKLPGEVRAALARGPELTLARLVALQRATSTRVERTRLSVRVRTAKGRAMAARRRQDEAPGELPRVATDLTRLVPEPVWCLDAVVARLAELLAARTPRSVLLVGPSGVGKTAAVRELARRRAEFGLGSTPFWSTSGARLVAGMTGYGMWQERCARVVREASRRRAVVHLGGLVELMQVGKSEHNALGIASFLRPSIARGELLAVAECTPEQLSLAQREDPHLVAAFETLAVAEPDAEQGREILRRFAGSAPPEVRKPLPADALDALDRLHRRYTSYSAYPGRPLRFLRGLLQDRRGEPSLDAGDVLDAFARETGLPRVLIDPRERLDLGRLRGWLAERVIDQPEAVELVADLVATAKAGLTRPRRPIASLLFIGPTGVGKTEMAKSLAEFLFGSRDRLTRFDMSEFGDPLAVRRLVGGLGEREGLLTARVREQPFGVLLFDEFEKADPGFFDLLLQVLGEGRLTDAAGRLADFSNAVVILTSNLGAEQYQQGAFGFGAAGADEASRREAARAHFRRAVEGFLRPELFNRLDRLVPFAPLGPATIERIAERHLRHLEERDGIRHRGVAVRLGEGVAAHLARAGFDARYGARPLLRAIERELLAPLADRMNRYSAEQALEVEVSLEGGALRLGVRARTDAAGRAIAAGVGAVPVAEAAARCVELRRRAQALERCRAVRELRNDLTRLEREQRLFEIAQELHARRVARLADAPEEVRRRVLARAPKVRPQDQERMGELGRLRPLEAKLRELFAEAAALEDEALLALYAGGGREAFAPADLAAASGPLERTLRELLATLYCRDFPDSGHLTLGLFGEDRDWLLELARGYAGAARELGLSVEMVAYRLPADRAPAPAPTPPAARTEEAPRAAAEPSAALTRQQWRQDSLYAWSIRDREREVLVREWVEAPDAFLADAPARLPGLALALEGTAAAPRFNSESGLHLLRQPRGQPTAVCLVVPGEEGLDRYLPPPGISRRGAIGSEERRRTYDRGAGWLDDVRLRRRVAWQGRDLAGALAEAVEDHFGLCLEHLLAEA
jgi:ATP-dependent Clp protease ATP-binding subunit ClpA